MVKSKVDSFSDRLSDFKIQNYPLVDAPPAYWYEGEYRGQRFRLPRTALVESIARTLMQHLSRTDRAAPEGKMYGVLLVETAGELRVLKACSGLLPGAEGWVPSIPGHDRVALQEAHTLTMLAAMKQELIALQQIPARQQYQALAQTWQLQRQEMAHRHQQQRQQRQQQRQTALAHHEALQLDQQSRQEGLERRRLKRQQDIALAPLQEAIDRADAQIRDLKQQRKALSRQLQEQMHHAYRLTNFAGESQVLQQIISGGMPTGTGDCCAPKLLHYAATQGFRPLAMAEFWWGASSSDKVQGEFYGACAERCQPLMGFLLSGLPQHPAIAGSLPAIVLPIYEDEWLIAVNKPAGLLSVPGRYLDRQDSVVSRLQHQYPEANAITATHRLDQETSGILLLSRDRQTHRILSQQFQQRQVYKVYEAVLAASITSASPIGRGVIDLPLWADPDDRPYQKVDWQRGKPSVTQYRVMRGETARLEFIPLTGRTHQIRVHAADPQGLGIPILGDRLYGGTSDAPAARLHHRLHLHARELRFQHPQTRQTLHLKTETPF